jgi:hypothetical protein
VAIISRSDRTRKDVLLSLKYYFISTASVSLRTCCKINVQTECNYIIQDNLQKTLPSYSIRLVSVDSGQPATKEYNVSSSNQMRESAIILQVNDSLQSGRIWNCVVTPATCKDIPLSDNTEISKTDKNTIKILKA